jgi:predicted kinase
MTSSPAEVRVVVITGPVGSGKTTIGDALSDLLADTGFRHSFIDMDRLRVTRPRPPGDPYGARAGWQHLAALWPLLLAEGARCVLLADVVEDRAGYLADLAAAAPGGRPAIVRLQVPMAVILRRLERRESPATLDWYRRRAPELQTIMEHGRVEDLLIDVGDRSPSEIAAEIRQWVSADAPR